jgi:acyl carrier protein
MLPSPSPDQSNVLVSTDAAVLGVVLTAMRNANMSRQPDEQLVVGEEAAIFGPQSPLDSLGLVALLMDVEEGLAAIGLNIVLSDERAMSQKRSPFRSVPALVQYIGQLSQS